MYSTKRISCLIALSLSCLAFCGFADTTTIDGIEWTYFVTNGKAEIRGRMESYGAYINGQVEYTYYYYSAVSPKPNGAITIPDKLGGYPVTSIGKYAFRECSRLTSVKIPDGVTKIGEYAFFGCSSLKNVTVPDSVTSIGGATFNGCSSLANIVLPFVGSRRGNAGTKESVFGYIFGEESYTGGTKVTQCYDGPVNSPSVAYYIPSSLKSVRITDETVLGYGSFYGCSMLTGIDINSSVSRVGGYSFRNCTGISNLTLPTKIMEIECGTFRGASKLNALSIPNCVTNVGDFALCDCSGLRNVEMPNSLCAIKSSAFSGCSKLTSVTIPIGTVSIGDAAFYGCSALTDVTFIGNAPIVSSTTFQGVNSECVAYVSNISTGWGVDIPGRWNGIKMEVLEYVVSDDLSFNIKDGVLVRAGSNCSGNIVIPNTVTGIGSSAFSGCVELTGVIVPSSVTSIGNAAFFGCSSLTNMVLPFVGSKRGNSGTDDSLFGYIFGERSYDGGTAIKQYYSASSYSTFYIPSSLRSVMITGESKLGYGAFYGCSKLTSVTIPHSVTSIESSAFSGCAGLTSMTLPFVGAKRGNSGTLDSVFGYIFGTSSYTGGKKTTQCYAGPNNSLSISYYIPTALKSVIITDESILGYGSFYGCDNLTNVTINSQVTNIGGYSFRNCTGIKNIRIPDSVIVIGTGAFRGSGINSIAIPNKVTKIEDYTFEGCGNLVSVTLHNGLIRIGPASFSGCSKLASVIIPDSVTSIGYEAFSGCSSLSVVTIPSSVTSVGYKVFSGCDELIVEIIDGYKFLDNWLVGYTNGAKETIPNIDILLGIAGGALDGCAVVRELVFSESARIRSIGGAAFRDCTGLQTLVLPPSLWEVGSEAFMGCTDLESIIVPRNVKHIYARAFKNCTYVRDVTIEDGVEVIDDGVFMNCTQLSSLAIPDTVTEIGDAAFSNCWRMLSVRLPLGLESVGVNMFSGCTSLTGVTTPTHAFTMKRLFGDRYSLIASVSVSAGETEVCDGAFAGCSALASVVMPNAITNIGNSAFASCSHLAGLELPESLDVIGAGAFSNCTALAAIVLPDGVTAIGQRAFYGCTSLANVTLSRSLASIPDYAFHGCSKLNSMVVPASVGSLGAYIGNYFSSLYYLGNAPSYDANVYASRSRTVTTYVVQGSRGWDGIPSSRDLPTSWNGYGITFWEPNRFDATFDANGGTFFDGSTAYACEQITDTGYALPPYEPTLEGFVFDGWWSDPYEGAQIKASVRVNETRDITFYAHWVGKPSSITVRFNPNGGTVEPAEGQYYSTLTYETLPVPTREHYKFAGWWTKAVGGNKIVASSRVPAADQELFARWTPETYTIRYNANGGTGFMADQSFVYGSAVVLRTNAFSKADKNFAGWAVAADGAVVYPDGGSLGSVAAIENGVINLYAVWRGNSYAVRFDSNGGVGSMDNATFEMDEQRALPVCAFTRDGFDFAGWATSPEGEPVYSDGAVVSALTDEVNGSFVLYAVWRAFTVEVPVVTPGDGSVFVGDSCEVSITCATAGAAIYYSTTGKAPKLTDKNRYTGAFIITNTTTIYAVATRGEAMAYAVVTISKQELTLQYVLGDGGKVGVSTSPDFPWEPVVDNGAAIGYSARSALPAEDDMDSWVELSVVGSGTLSFMCKTSCEWDYTGGCEFDCLMMATNGVEIVGMRLDGIQDNWVDRAVTFSGDGEHKLRIIYHKDESDFDGEDCAWLGDVRWTPAGAAVPIPAVAVDADASTVNAAVDEVGFADAAVKEVIGGSAEEYNAFKTWVDGVKGPTGDALAGEAAVVANAHAAAAYLLGAERLFENEPTVEIGELAIAEGESAGTTAMTVAVTVKDGESAVAVSAAKVAAMFEATSDLGDWTGAAKLTPTVTPSGTDASGKMTFVVTPGDGTASKAFLRIKR